MFKKLCSLIILLSLLYSDIAYPLTNRSPFQSEKFRQFVNTIASGEVTEDRSGTWLIGEDWKIRFYRKENVKPKLDSCYELIYKENLGKGLSAQVYFKGLSNRDRDEIVRFLREQKGLSKLTRRVLREIAGPIAGRVLRRNLSKKPPETLSRFISGLPADAQLDNVVEAVVRDSEIEIGSRLREILKDYIKIFMRQMALKEKSEKILEDKDLFIFKKLKDLKGNPDFEDIKLMIENLISEKKLRIVRPKVIVRIVERAGILPKDFIDPNTNLSFTWGSTIFFSNEARLCDFIMYIAHEVVHLCGGKEDDARKVDKEVLAVLKGMVSLMRELSSDMGDGGELLNSIADVMEYEILGYELDLHTARLQVFVPGMAFLDHFGLSVIEVTSRDEGYVREMKRPMSGIIKEGKDSKLFNEIRRIVQKGGVGGGQTSSQMTSAQVGMGIFKTFVEYIRRKIEEKSKDKKELLAAKDVAFVPEYQETLLSYTITMEEAERRIREVVLNPEAPLFARINEAIMLDIYSKNENVELHAVESIKPIVMKEPAEALEILRGFRNSKSVELISELLSHNDYKIRRQAAQVLFRMVMDLVPIEIFNSARTLENLISFVNKPTISTRDRDLVAFRYIVLVLSCIKCKEAMPIFLEVMEKNRSRKIREFVGNALGGMRDTSIIPAVRDRVWQKKDRDSVEISISCLEEVPNDESAEIIIDTFLRLKAKEKELKMRCLSALKIIIEKRRISVDILLPIIEPLMDIISKTKGEELAGLNFILGRFVSLAIQEGRFYLLDKIFHGKFPPRGSPIRQGMASKVIALLFAKGSKKRDTEIFSRWKDYIMDEDNILGLVSFGRGLIHDTFLKIDDIRGLTEGNPLAEVFSLIMDKFVGNWGTLVEYMRKIRDDIYEGKRVYKDKIWKEIAALLKITDPKQEFIIGKQWFQRSCLSVAYRVLLDTWNIGKIEDRDFILELMILRSKFVPSDELAGDAIGETEVIHGDYVNLDDSFFSTPLDIPVGVNTVWHEAAHLLRAMGIADIGDINLLGASSHSNIELYLLSGILKLPPIADVIARLRKGESVEKIIDDYKKGGVPQNRLGDISTVLQGMAVRDRAKGPTEAFLMVRRKGVKSIDSLKQKGWTWEDILWKLKKINTEIMNAFTIRGEGYVLVNTYVDGDRFSGYAQRLGVEAGFYDAANIYTEMIIRYRLSPSQAEFISRLIARFMTQEKDWIGKMFRTLKGRCAGAPAGEIEKWLRKYIIDYLKFYSFRMREKAGLWITYGELDSLMDDAYVDIRRLMERDIIQREIMTRVKKSISVGKKIFKIITRERRVSLNIAYVTDTDGETRPISWHYSPDLGHIILEADFGEGSKVYGYVNAATKEIKLENPDDSRIPLDEISRAIGMDLTRNDFMEINKPRDKKYFQWSSYLEFLKGVNWKKIGKNVFLGVLFMCIFVLSSILNLSKVEWGLMLLAAILVIWELKIIWRIIVEDIEFKLPKELKKKLKENRVINNGVRKFIDDIYNGNLITKTGQLFLINDFNRVLLAYDREGLINLFNREFGMDKRVSGKVIDYGLKALEYKEKVDVGDLMSTTMTLYTEEVISSIANGNCFFRTKEQKVKRIGIAECLDYARKGKRGLYKVLCNSYSYKIIRIRKTSAFIAEDVTNIIYDIYLSLEKKEGKESLVEFAEKIIQLDVSNYIMPPLTRYRLIKGFKARGIKFLESEVSKSRKRNNIVDRKIFDAVLDTLGIDDGLAFLKEVREKTENRDLYYFLMAYLGTFEISPNDYIPVQILDAWGSFNLQRKRRGDFTYKDAQCEFIRLYMKYIKNQKGGMPKWGWTFLWLGYFKKGSKMNDAVLDLLKLLMDGKDVNNTDIDDLSEKHKLGSEEKERLMACMPIGGFITMVEIYCKDVVWGRQNLGELEKDLKRNMNVVLDEDIASKDIYNSEVDKWIYTFKNMPGDLREKVKDDIRRQVIDLILERTTESGIVIDKDAVRSELYRIFDLIFATRLPEKGERFVDSISITGLCKVLFDYAKNIIKDGQKLRKSHFAKNKEISKRESAGFKGKSKDDILPAVFSGEGKKEFKEYSKDSLGEFYRELGNSKKLVIFTHRHTETIGLLYWIRDILKEEEYKSLEVHIVPQKSLWESNSTREDIMAVLNDNEMGLQELAGFREKGRFTISDDCAGGFSWLNCPERLWVKEELESNCIVLGAGWDNFVSMQGLNRPCYFIFGVDNEIKKELTGCEINEPVFVKTCGGIPATKIGVYNLHEYLENTNSAKYITLLSYFGGDRINLHEWIKMEARRTNGTEIDVMVNNSYCEEPGLMFGKCALRNIDAGIRGMAMDIMLNNYKNEKFGIVKQENISEVNIDGITIQISKQADVYYLPSLNAAVVVSNGKKLIIEIIKGEDNVNYLRIGDMVYGITVNAVVNLNSLIMEPALWIGNSALVEFFGIDGKNGIREEERVPPGVFLKDVPHQIIRKIPTAMSPSIYKKAEESLAESVECLPLRLHYVIVLLSSTDKNQCVKGLAELEKLRTAGDSEIIKLMKERGVKRVGEWILQEVPVVDRDIFHVSNFTIEQESILRVLQGGYLLRPPLVEMPGQGVSARFHDLMASEMRKFGIDLVRGNYAEGVGSVLFEGGRRHFIKEGDLLIGLAEGLMPGAFRLTKNGKEIIQLPNNSSILNYLKAIHHLAHITSAKLIESRRGEPDPLQEFTPSIEDVLVIKYAERLISELKDGFSDFKEEVAGADSDEELSWVFARYGLNVPYGKELSQIKEEIEGIENMLGFSDYIMKNNLGRFISVKEFLNVLVDYKRETMKDYIRQLSHAQQILVERLLSAKDSEEINSLLIVASFLAGCYIPKVAFKRDIDAIMEILRREEMAQKLDRKEILNKIDNILGSGEPFSAKAVRIVGTILYKMDLKVNSLSGEERRRIEQEVMDILSGKWWQEIGESLAEKISELDAKGVDTGNLRDELEKIRKYKIGEPRELGEANPVEAKDTKIESIDSWDKIIEIVDREGIRRVFFDIDRTTIDAVGFVTTTPWFKKMIEQEGLEETIRQWREIEEEQFKGGFFHLMEDCIPEVIAALKERGVEIYFYTARDEEDLDRTKRILTYLGIDLDGIEIITSRGGTPELKRDALVEYYEKKGWFKREKVPSLFMDDTQANPRTVCSDRRFDHIRCLWYRPHYEKSDKVDVEELLRAGEQALRSGNTMKALLWYLNAFYFRTRKDISNQIYDTVLQNVGFGSSIEEMFYKFTEDRLRRYKIAVEREEVWTKPEPEEEEKKKVKEIEEAPDIPDSETLKGIKRIIVIGSHAHGDHVKGFLNYAKRKLKNLVETLPPSPGKRKTGGSITHSMSNYWGRLDDETIVLFDLGWFPEGFIDPLIQTINPKDREIVFIMDPSTERTMGFSKQLNKLKLEGVKLRILPYNEIIEIPIDNGKKIIEIENYPAYHLAEEVGSSIYMVRTRDKKTRKVLHGIGYISELGDLFPEKVDHELLKKLASLDQLIVDGTNIIAPAGEEPMPHKDSPNKIHEYVKALNQGKFLISHFNTTSIRMGEDAEVANENLDPDIPIVIIGGEESIDQLKRAYEVPDDRDYYTIGERKVYLVHDVVSFHRKLREEGQLPTLDEVLSKRIRGLKDAGWTDSEIGVLVREWSENNNQEIKEYEGPAGKVREIEALFWDLRKTQAVVISSSQFRGDPTKGIHRHYKGFQILDAIAERKEASILVEGRKHIKGEEGVVLRGLFGKDKKIISITGKKEVRATVDQQWRSGHIAFTTLMFLLYIIADEAVKSGNVYNTRTFIPVPKEEWLRLIDGMDKINKFGREDIGSVAKIINDWNSNKVVTYEDMQFVRKVMKEILENESFFRANLGIEDAEELKRELLARLERIEKESKLQGRAKNKIFVASTSKFIDVLRKQIIMDPKKISELFRNVARFCGFEFGVSYEVGVTIDLVTREKEEYSRDLKKELKREYLKELYVLTSQGKIPPDLSRYHEKKGLDKYRAELEEVFDKIKRKSKRAGNKKKLFDIWFGELKKYIESQYLRIGLRYADKLAPYSELRKELTYLYDAVIESVYNFLQEDMQWKYKDISIIACGDYADIKVLFKDNIVLGVLGKKQMDAEYVERLKDGMQGILNGLGIPVEFDKNWPSFLHKRRVITYAENIDAKLKDPISKDILSRRNERLREDLKILNERDFFNFDIHEGPGGLDDIDLIRYFFGQNMTDEEKEILNEAEEFLRRCKEEIGLSTGGREEKTKALFSQIMNNIGFLDDEEDFMNEFFKKVLSVYTIFLKFAGKELHTAGLSTRIGTPPPIPAGISSRGNRFSQLVCGKIKEKYNIDVSLDDLETDLQSLKIRLVPKLNGIQTDGLSLINDISGIVMESGLETDVSNDVMIKAVIIVASQILPKLSIILPPAKPMSLEDLEELYEVVKSA